MNQARRGLTTEEAALLRETKGANVYEKLKRKSFGRRLLENFKDPIIRILLIAMGVNLLFTIKNINWAENAGIILAVLISTFVSAISEQGSERAFERLKEEQKKVNAQVLRDGKPVILPVEELVVGDLVFLHPGNRIPADGRILAGMLKVDQSAVNGEAEPTGKRPSRGGAEEEQSRVFAGTMVTEGEAEMLVTAVGSESIYGQIAKDIQRENEESPLKKRLSKLAGTITKIGYVAAIVVAVTYLFNVFILDSGFDRIEILLRLSNFRFVALNLVKAVTIAMTVIVVAVPEGLPMMITVVLSSNMKKMLKGNVLVRKLVGIETSGCMNILFTDKTGTLTEGKPVCSEMVFGNGNRFDGKRRTGKRLEELLRYQIFLNTSCKEAGGRFFGGNSTEQALAEFWTYEAGNSTVVKDFLPFSSQNKYSVCQIEENGIPLTLFKGAPEMILRNCRSYLDETGEERPFDGVRMTELVKKLSSKGKRILALSYSRNKKGREMDKNSVFLAIVVLNDALRKGAREAVKELQNAGVHTVMITGDSKETAEAIGRECGIYENGKSQYILSGQEMAEKTDQWLMENIERLAIVCRALPNDKNRLVKICKKKGLVTGMTGDGINDAPALKSADVGFAMGSGAEIAKEASDIIILDNNLQSIINAVLYGRTVFKSIRKFITFQLIMNLCAVGVSLFGQLMGIDNPVTVIQMLWVNIIMDTLGGLAFAGEYPQRHYLKERPLKREEPILTGGMLWQILLMGGYGTTMCSCFLGNRHIRSFLGYNSDPLPLLTAFFALFIFTGIVICFTARSERVNLLYGLRKNRPFLLIMMAVTGIQMLMLYFGGSTFRCVGLTPQALLLVALLALSVLPVDLVRRIITKSIVKTEQKKHRKKSPRVSKTEELQKS